VRTPPGLVVRPVGREAQEASSPGRVVPGQGIAVAAEQATNRATEVPARVPAAAAPATTTTTIMDGELVLHARPWCNGMVDGRLPISDVHPNLRLPPGTHRVRCQGPQGMAEERMVTVAAGERSEVSFDFRQTTVVELRLSRGDQVAFGDAPPSAAPQRQTTGVAREVRLFRHGQEIDHGYVDILPGCVLVDAPRLECRK